MTVSIQSQCTSANSTWIPNLLANGYCLALFFFFSFLFFFTFLRIQFLYIYIYIFQPLVAQHPFFYFSSCSERFQKVFASKGFLRELSSFLVFPTTKAVSRFRAFLKALSREVHPLLFNNQSFLTKKSDTLQFSPNYSYNDSFILSLGYI